MNRPFFKKFILSLMFLSASLAVAVYTTYDFNNSKTLDLGLYKEKNTSTQDEKKVVDGLEKKVLQKTNSLQQSNESSSVHVTGSNNTVMVDQQKPISKRVDFLKEENMSGEVKGEEQAFIEPLTQEQQKSLREEYDRIVFKLRERLDEKSSKDIFVLEEIKRKAWRELGQKYLDDPLAVAILQYLEDEDKEQFARGLIAGLVENNPQGLIDELLGEEPPRSGLVEALKSYDNKTLGLVDEALLSMSPYNAIEVLSAMNLETLKDGTLNKVFAGYENAVGLELGLEKLSDLIGSKSQRDDVIFYVLNQKNDYREAIYQASLLDQDVFGKYNVMGRLLQRWSENDLPQALEYFDDFMLNYSVEKEDLKKVLISWKYGKNSSDEHEIKKYYTDKVHELFYDNKVDEAKSLLSALMDQKDFNPNVISLISQMSREDPEATKQWLSEFKGDDQRINEWKKTLYATWGRDNPEMALNAAATLPILKDNEVERAYAYSNIAIRLGQHEGNHNLSPYWIKDLPEGFVRDRSVAGYALGHARHSKDAEAEYALKKQFQLDQIDMDKVLEIVQESSLEDRIKEQISELR